VKREGQQRLESAVQGPFCLAVSVSLWQIRRWVLLHGSQVAGRWLTQSQGEGSRQTLAAVAVNIQLRD